MIFIQSNYQMGKPKKQKDPEPIPTPVAPVTPEDEDIKKAGDDERRRIAAQRGRNQSVTSQRPNGGSTILG
jgi:hypothetical protein